MVTLQESGLLGNSSDLCLLFFGTRQGIVSSLIIVFLITNSVVGLPANLYMIWSICDGRKEEVVAEIHHLVLAVCEVSYCLGLPVELYSWTMCTRTGWSMPHHIYNLLSLQIGLLWIGRPIFQCFICVERYIAVVHPLTFLRLKQPRYKVGLSILSWTMVIGLISTNTVTKESWFFGLMWVVLVLCIFIYCCCAVLFSLMQSPPGERERDKETSGVRMKRRAFNIILAHLLGFLLNFLPGFFLFYLMTGLDLRHLFSLFRGVGTVCGLIHPLLYIHRAGKFSQLWSALMSLSGNNFIDLFLSLKR